MSNKGIRTFVLALVSALPTLSARAPAVGRNDAAQAMGEEKKDAKKGADVSVNLRSVP